MGLVKRLLNEEPDVKFSFECPNPDCGSEVEGGIEDATFDVMSESVGDGEGVSTTVVACPDCNTDYDVTLVAGPIAKSITLDDHPDVAVHFQDDTLNHELYDSDYEDFLSQWEPTEPGEVFLAAFNELEGLDYGSTVYPQSKHVFDKMLFVQHIVILEAYLSDRLISVVTNDEDCLVKLIGCVEELRTHQPKLIDVAKNPDYVKNHAKSFLQRVSFHNLEAVAPYFKAVLGAEIFENDANKLALVKVVETRHHLVHRNGRRNDDTDVNITKAEIDNVKELSKKVFDRVESTFRKYAIKRSQI